MEKLLRKRHLSSNRNDLCVYGKSGVLTSQMEKQLSHDRRPITVKIVGYLNHYPSQFTLYKHLSDKQYVHVHVHVVRTLIATFSPPVAHFCRDFVFSSRILIHRFSLVMSVCRRLAPGELEERGGEG